MWNWTLGLKTLRMYGHLRPMFLHRMLTMIQALDRVWCRRPPHPNSQDRKVSCCNVRLPRPNPIPPLCNRPTFPRRGASGRVPEPCQKSTTGAKDTTARCQELRQQGAIPHTTSYCGSDSCCGDLWGWCPSDHYSEGGHESCCGHIESVEAGEVLVGEWEELSDH